MCGSLIKGMLGSAHCTPRTAAVPLQGQHSDHRATGRGAGVLRVYLRRHLGVGGGHFQPGQSAAHHHWRNSAPRHQRRRLAARPRVLRGRRAPHGPHGVGVRGLRARGRHGAPCERHTRACCDALQRGSRACQLCRPHAARTASASAEWRGHRCTSTAAWPRGARRHPHTCSTGAVTPARCQLVTLTPPPCRRRRT